MQELKSFMSNSGSLSELLEQSASPQKSGFVSPQKSVEHVKQCRPPEPERKGNWAQVVGQKKFGSREEFETYLLVGKYRRDSSPCVDYNLNDQEALAPEHSLVYEQWQKHLEKEDKRRGMSSKFMYRCRRHRPPTTQKRPSAKESVACGCKAKLTAAFSVNGAVTITFRGKHNHPTQGGKAFEYINPVHECQQIREMVDEKLYAGITKAGQIRSN